MVKIVDLRFQKLKGGGITVSGTITSAMVLEAGGMQSVIMELAGLMGGDALKLSLADETSTGAPETLVMLKDGVERLVQLAEGALEGVPENPDLKPADTEAPELIKPGEHEEEPEKKDGNELFEARASSDETEEYNPAQDPELGGMVDEQG